MKMGRPWRTWATAGLCASGLLSAVAGPSVPLRAGDRVDDLLPLPPAAVSNTPAGAVISLPGLPQLGRPGAPDLPRLVRVFRHGTNVVLTVHITSEGAVETNAAAVAPTATVILDSPVPGPGRFRTERKPDTNLYSWAGWWPTQLVETATARQGSQLVTRVVCYPVQYHPTEQRYRQHLRLHLTVEAGVRP